MKSSKFKVQSSKFERGFTLIELLIVVAIMGIMTAVLTVNFIGIRERARDAQRKSELAQIQNALEFYKTDQNVYPPATEFTTTRCNLQFPSSGSTIYLKKIPCDPASKTAYPYTTSGTSYTLYACLENTKDTDKNTQPTKPFSSGPNCTSSKYYTVNDP